MIVFLKRVIKYGWEIFSRDGEIIFANVFILMMAIFLLSSLFIFREISKILITSLKEKADISIYFKEEIGEEEIFKVKEKIVQIPEVKEINYISKEKAFEDFLNRYKDNPVLMESYKEIGENFLLAALEIKAFRADQYQKIIDFLENSEIKNLIDHTTYPRARLLIEKIFSLSTNLEKSGIFFSIILILIAIVVTFNTIRLSIINFGEEISIQRLVGASNWFIRGPFIVQGVIAGFFAAILSFTLLFFLCWFLTPKVKILFEGLDVFQVFFGKKEIIVLIQILVGIGLGTISSLIAIRRYLKV